MFSGTNNFDNLLSTFVKAKEELGEILSSFELIDAKSLEVVTDYFKLKSPIGIYPFYILIETQGSNSVHDEEKLNAFLENVMDQKIVLDGTTTNEPGKMRVRFVFHFFNEIS